jgi:hypothetical protein
MSLGESTSAFAENPVTTDAVRGTCNQTDGERNSSRPRAIPGYSGSDDGVHWRRTGIVCVDYDADAQAIGRPWVVRLEDRYGCCSHIEARWTIAPTQGRVTGSDTPNPPTVCNVSENRIPPDWICRPMAGTR